MARRYGAVVEAGPVERLVDVQHARPGLFRQRAEDPQRRGIAAAIVDDQQPHRLALLRMGPQALDEMAEIDTVVAGRDDNKQGCGPSARLPADDERRAEAGRRLDGDWTAVAGGSDIGAHR